VNGYVVAGWSVTAAVLALYTWRLIRRGHLLTRTLPAEPLPAEFLPAEPLARVATPVVSPSGGSPPDGSSSVERPATVTGSNPDVGAWR
jgi:hypothetical protein